MSFATDIYTLLSTTDGVSDIVGSRISPYVRNTGDEFPAVVFQIPREEIESDSAGRDLMRIATIEITCLARTYIDADLLAEAVVIAVKGATPVARSLTIDRDFGDPYDGSQDLVYRSTVTATLTGSTT